LGIKGKGQKGYHIYCPSIHPYHSYLAVSSFYHARVRSKIHAGHKRHDASFHTHMFKSTLLPSSVYTLHYSQSHLPRSLAKLIHLLQSPSTTNLPLLNRNPHQTPLQHPLPINPRMHLPKQPTPIPPRSPQQLRLAARMVRCIRTNIIHLPAQHRPRILSLPARHLLQQRRRDLQVRRVRR